MAGGSSWLPAGVAVAEVLVGDAVEAIAAPVEFFLQGDHAGAAGLQPASYVSSRAARDSGKCAASWAGQVRLPFLGQAIQGSGEVQGFVCGNGKLLQAGAGELIEVFKCDGGLTCSLLIHCTAFIMEDLLHPKARRGTVEQAEQGEMVILGGIAGQLDDRC